MTKGDIAKKYFEDGYNCSQAVYLHFVRISDLIKKLH